MNKLIVFIGLMLVLIVPIQAMIRFDQTPTVPEVKEKPGLLSNIAYASSILYNLYANNSDPELMKDTDAAVREYAGMTPKFNWSNPDVKEITRNLPKAFFEERGEINTYEDFRVQLARFNRRNEAYANTFGINMKTPVYQNIPIFSIELLLIIFFIIYKLFFKPIKSKVVNTTKNIIAKVNDLNIPNCVNDKDNKQANKLKEWHELFQQGIITEDEYKAKKDNILK